MTQKTFVRQATGLVRQMSLFDSIAVNVGAVPVVGGFVYCTFILWLFPGANMPLSIWIIAAILAAGMFLAYSLFAATMPRSGGDYIYVSRTLHPSLGFAGNITMFVFSLIALGFQATITVGIISDTFFAQGLVSRNSGLVGIGRSLSAPTATFGFSFLLLILFGLLAFWSTKRLVGLISVCLIVSVVTAIIAVFVLLSVNPATFIPRFNSFIQPYTNNSDTYHNVINAARNAGYTVPNQWSWTQTIKTLPLHIEWIGYFFWFTYNGGEFKNASSVKRWYGSMIGSLILIAGLVSTLLALIEQAAGHAFVASMYYDYANLPNVLPIPAPPYFNLFAAIITDNPALTAMISIGFVAGQLMLVAVFFTMLTRVMLAYSFDRMLPAKMSDVNTRFGTPHYGILVSVIVSIAATAIYLFVSPGTFTLFFLASGYSPTIFDFGLVGIAAIAFAYLRKDVFAKSPISKYKVGKVPLLTIAGVITVLLVAYSTYNFYTDSTYGLIGSSSALVNQVIVLGMFVVPLVAYFIVNKYRHRQGIDMRLIFKEIPPE